MADFENDINVAERHDEETKSFYREEEPQYPDDVEVTYMGPQNESEGHIGIAEVGIGGLAIGGGIAGVYLLVKGCRKLYNWITKKDKDDDEDDEEERKPRKKPVKKKAASKKKTTKKRPPKKVEEDDYEDGEYEDLDVDSDEETDED